MQFLSIVPWLPWRLASVFTVLLLSAPLLLSAEIAHLDLQLDDLELWEEKSFAGNTHYQKVMLDGQPAVKADSHKSASGLFREINVDLRQTPYLNWQWRIGHTLGDLNERTREGDDYPARVYVVISGGVFFWKTRALNYVWSNNQPPGSFWSNAFTDNAVMVAVTSGDEKRDRWQPIKRNVLEDIKTYLGMEADEIDAVAIMTDTDNSGGQVTSYYRQLFFSAK